MDEIVFTKQELALLVNGLYDLPYKMSSPMINHIQKVVDRNIADKETKDNEFEKAMEQMKDSVKNNKEIPVYEAGTDGKTVED